MSKQPISLHASTHLPDGSDPLGGIFFDFDNEGGWLFVQSNDSTDMGYGDLGILLADTTSAGISLIARDSGNTKQGVLFMTPDLVQMSISSGGPKFSLNRSTGNIEAQKALNLTGMTGATAATRWVGATASGAPVSGTFVAGDWITTLNAHVWICTTGGTPGAWADVGGGGGGGIDFGTNTGTYLVVEASAADPVSGRSVYLHDTSTGGDGAALVSDSGAVFLLSGATDYFSIQDGTGATLLLAAGESSTIYNHSAAPILSTDEATGVTSGVFDGGGA